MTSCLVCDDNGILAPDDVYRNVSVIDGVNPASAGPEEVAAELPGGGEEYPH